MLSALPNAAEQHFPPFYSHQEYLSTRSGNYLEMFVFSRTLLCLTACIDALNLLQICVYQQTQTASLVLVDVLAHSLLVLV